MDSRIGEPVWPRQPLASRIAAGHLVLRAVLSVTPARGLPWVTNHFGFAFPVAGGLPFRLRHAGRTDATTGRCARAACAATTRRPAARTTPCAADGAGRMRSPLA
jgi:hypothetical protein